MAEIKHNIFSIDAGNLSRFYYINDEELKSTLQEVQIPNTFIPYEDFIELSYFTLDNTRLSTVSNYNRYSINSGDTVTDSIGNSEISIDPVEDYKAYNGSTSEVKALYHFLRDSFLTTDIDSTFSIESIAPDRKEARIIPQNLNAFDVERLANTLKNKIEASPYNLDIHLYCGDNTFYSIINIDYRSFRGTTAVVLRFAESLPTSIKKNKIVRIVEKVSNSIAYEINTSIIPDEIKIPTLRGANFNVEVEDQSTEPSEYFNYNELFSFPTTNTYREINTLFNEKGAEIGVDYSSFSDFINFSSAEERLRNFRYKLQLLEQYQTQLDVFNDPGFPYSGTGATGSTEYWNNLVQGVINNFDHYERHLFYSSGSSSWPKGNAAVPYENLTTSDTTALTWYNSSLQDAVLYDASNPDLLTNTIPAYLKEDENNRPYELFIHMIAQHFDNLWLYTNAVSKKYDNDNRLDRGVSKDLVEDLLKNFGVKLYTSNRSAQDLFRYFTANSYDIVDSEPDLQPIISGSDFPISQNDYQKEIYKRIYHNLPLLMKSKGTERGLRALINCFGIPSDILKIRIHGGRSSEDLPFFAGDRAFTGSIDKVRLNNTGSIVPGDTLSQYTSIIKPDNFYTQDLHNIEVGFSPSYNINAYIVSQSAVLFPNTPFDIDDYIGDPRGYETSKYLPLYAYAETVLADVETYDLKDFVRLIKFFDNVIFRMVRDFVPARAVADTGIIIKPHLLDRSKFKSPIMSWTRPEYTGSINTAFISGSHGNAYRSVGFGASGSLFKQESSTRYKQLVKTPSGSKYKYWSTTIVPTNLSPDVDPLELNPVYDRGQEQAKFDGELSGSHIQVTNGELNEDNPYKELLYRNVIYDVSFYHAIPDNICILSGKGTEENPYILRYPTPPEEVSGWPIPIFFNFASAAGHTYANEFNEDIPTTFPYTFEQEFGGVESEVNYLDTIVTAVKTSLNNCTDVTHIKKVICDININTEILPEGSNVYSYATYNLFNLFSSIYNTNTDILINNVPITDTQAEDYQFSGDEGSAVEILIRDEVDNTCSHTRNVTLSNCSLRQYPPANGGENTVVTNPNSPLQSFNPVGFNGGIPPEIFDGFYNGVDGELHYFTDPPERQEYNLSTSIIGGDINTIWGVIFKYTGEVLGGDLLNEDGSSMTPEDPNLLITDELPLIFAPEIVLSEGSPNYRLIPTLPVEKQLVHERYISTLGPLLGTSANAVQRIQSFSIVARSHLIESCVVSTPFFKLAPPEPSNYLRVDFVEGNDYTSVCSTFTGPGGVPPTNRVSVYVNRTHIPPSLLDESQTHPADNPTVRQYILRQQVKIYMNSEDTSPKLIYRPNNGTSQIYLGDNVIGDQNEDGFIARKWNIIDDYNGSWEGAGQWVHACGLGQ